MTDETPTNSEHDSPQSQSDGQEVPAVLFQSRQAVDPVISHTESVASASQATALQLPDPLQTPEIAAPVPHPELPVAAEKSKETLKHKSLSRLLQIGLYIVLFVFGLGVGLWVRQLRINPSMGISTPTPTPTQTITVTPTAAYSNWNATIVLNGKSRQPIPGVAFKLPPNVMPLSCDGGDCASQGTYLPGGTRFTVAARGEDQVLPDFRGADIIDVGGIAFATTQVGLGTRTAIAFRGEFPGTTIGGYTFSEMRGIMIPLSPGLSLEVNHFSPRGVTTNFITDDALFDQIIETFDFTGSQIATSTAVVPSVALSPAVQASPAAITATP